MRVRPKYKPNHPAGFTLVELLIVVVIVAVGLALAVPTYQDIVERRQITRAAEEVASFLGQARGWAVKTNDELTVSYAVDANGRWCFGMASGTTACDCATTPAACVVEDLAASDAQVVLDGFDRSTTPPTDLYPRAQLIAASADTAFTFDPVRGIKQTADLATHTYEFQSANGNWELHVRIDPTGRVRVCHPADAPRDVPGFAEC